MDYTLIANTGIHLISIDLEIDIKEKFSLWFHEWYNTTDEEWVLDLAQEVTTDTNRYFYRKHELFVNGYLKGTTGELEVNVSDLNDEGIRPLMIDDSMQTMGEIFKMNFADKNNALSSFENQWLPIPYFFKRSETKFKFGPLNWSRFKLIPIKGDDESIRKYKVLLAFDTRIGKNADTYNECPVFPDQFMNEMTFEVCRQEFQLMDFCSPKSEWEYINNYIFNLVHPGLSSVGKIKTGRRLSYIASYFLLIDYIAQNRLFPKVSLFKDCDVVVKDVDMVVDIGNSKTTALLVEDNSNFNQVNQLQLIDYTSLLSEGQLDTNIYKDPFDMRLAFRKVEFGDLGIQGSRQFVFPSFVRLGKEANFLMHKANDVDTSSQESLSTMSSPKRYLWDGYKSKEEWKFMVLENEKDNHILNIPGISEYLRSDGQISINGSGGQSYHYSRRSLMTFAFLEMLTQAQTQINSHQYRVDRGDKIMPRRIRRIVVTCPTAMSKLEREALIRCASDAVKLMNFFKEVDYNVEIVPRVSSFRDTDSKWYYDEATCSQLVYIYGEVGYKYKGSCQEFFNLYGRTMPGVNQPELTIGSLDIGAGTSDLMISRYSYTKEDVTTITPDPLFYDSFYYAGDEMLNELIKNVMFFSKSSAFRRKMSDLSEISYRQVMRNFFGPDYTGQTVADRKLRRDFNMQYSIPLMYYYLDMLAKNVKDCTVRYSDVFDDCPPNERVKAGFRKFFKFDIEELEWEFNKASVAEVVSRAFEPLLKKIATIMYSYNCDIVLLSGRPSSLSPIRKIFLKYYSVSPNRLILLNNYFVGHWYPFSNNSGYISNAKTIVAMGALIGYYATSLGNLDGFLIDKSKLDEKLESVVNYIEASKEGQPIEYFITPEKNTGELMVSSLPITLNVRQIGFDSYPSRKLYIVDFNRYKMIDRVRNKSIQEGSPLGDTQIMAKVEDIVDDLRRRMPFSLSIERSEDDKEKLSVTSIRDKNGTDLSDSSIEINIQSLGADERYWLDTGAFDIQ